MLTKLPRWVEYGAFTLALLAGLVNAVGLLGFQHQAVSHVSGIATSLGVEMARLQPGAIDLALILLSFLAGSAISGFFLKGQSLKLGRHYELLLAIEGVLLLAAIVLLERQTAIGHYLASMACGLQNALATTYSGAVIRTTHVTGVLTDIGIMLGSLVRGAEFDRRKFILLLLLITGFICGGTAGTILYVGWGFKALVVPALICFALAGTYRFYSKSGSQ